MASNERLFRQPRVVIIGAGMAGLAAASALIDASFADVIVVEAETRIGGRVHSFEKDGRVFEVGAGWLHYTDTELYRICAENSFIEHANSDQSTSSQHNDDDLILDHALVFSDVEKPLSRSYCQVIYDNLDVVDLLLPPPAAPLADDAVFDAACETIHADDVQNSSFGDVLVKKYAEGDAVNGQLNETNGEDATSTNENDGEYGRTTGHHLMQRRLKLAAIDLSARIVLDDFGAHSLFEISLGVGHQEESGSGAYLTRLKVPLSYLIDRVRANIPDHTLQLGCCVKQISFSPNNRYPVELVCERSHADGKTEAFGIDADHVIITIPVGALKVHYADLFSSSPLSDAKKLAVESFGMGYMGNLFFQFPVDDASGKTWWQENIVTKWKPFMTIPVSESDLLEHNMPFAMHMVHLEPEVLECGLKFMLSRSNTDVNCSHLIDAAKCSRHQLHKITCNWTRYISGLYFFPVLQTKSKSQSFTSAADEFANDHSWCKILLPGGVSHFVDSLSDYQVLREFSTFIRRMVGDPSIRNATQVVRRRWGSEPGYYGSFSYPSVACAKHFGTSGSDVLGRPEWMYEKQFGSDDVVRIPGLLFAGEATSTTGLGYMHGAYDSGKREARRLIEIYRV